MIEGAQARFSMEEFLRNVPEADWVREMREYFAETGAFRPEDLARVLGDPCRGIEMPQKPDCLSAFQIHS